MTTNDELQPNSEQLKSKSQLKKEVHEITKLGEQIVDSHLSLIDSLQLSPVCKKAILEARNITSHIGKKRQLKYIGKLLRDEDLDSIRVILKTNNQDHTAEVKQLHLAERWRDRLLEEGDKAIGELIERHPSIDRQHLRQLIRNVQKETTLNKPPKYKRELFQLLKSVLL